MFQSSSKLPWLSGNTRRHFPVREATKDKQLDRSDPTHTKHFNHTHNMLDMCKYNMASQHNSTTQSIYSLGSEERDITNMGLMTQHTEHTNNKHMRKLNLSEYRALQMKKAKKPDYLPDPADATRS